MERFKIANYFLDIKAIEALTSESQKSTIHQYYNELIHGQYGPGATESISNTLIRGGFLKSIIVEDRDEKIETILS